MDQDEAQFLAVGCDLQEHPAGTHLRLNFFDSNNKSRAIVLTRESLPLLVGALHPKIGDGTVVPIDQKSLQVAANIRVEGWDLEKRPDRSARLTIYLEMRDQGRTVMLPLDLSPENVTCLKTQLSREATAD
jgi:hypothetical protein